MIFTVEIPDNAKNIKVAVFNDGKQCCYINPRYERGHWNGLNGGVYYGQYFDMDDVNRVKEMIEIASVLRDYGINYVLSKFKRQYRIMISSKDYFTMDKTIKEQILSINFSHDLEESR